MTSTEVSSRTEGQSEVLKVIRAKSEVSDTALYTCVAVSKTGMKRTRTLNVNVRGRIVSQLSDFY